MTKSYQLTPAIEKQGWMLISRRDDERRRKRRDTYRAHKKADWWLGRATRWDLAMADHQKLMLEKAVTWALNQRGEEESDHERWDRQNKIHDALMSQIYP